MRRVLSVLGNILLAIALALLFPFVILLVGLPIVAIVKIVQYLAGAIS